MGINFFSQFCTFFRNQLYEKLRNVIEYYILRNCRTHYYHEFKTSSPLDVLSHFFYFLTNFNVAYLDPKMSNNSVTKLKENIMNGTSMKSSWEGIPLSICF